MIIRDDDKSPSGAKEACRNTLHRLLPSELATHPGYLLGYAADVLRGELNQVTASLGLNMRHMGLLYVLAARGALRQTDLTDAVNIDRTTIMKLVDDLEAGGYAQRERDSTDRRANAVTVTAAGRMLLETQRPQLQAIEGEFMKPLSAHEQALLTDLLRRLIVAPGN